MHVSNSQNCGHIAGSHGLSDACPEPALSVTCSDGGGGDVDKYLLPAMSHLSCLRSLSIGTMAGYGALKLLPSSLETLTAVIGYIFEDEAVQLGHLAQCTSLTGVSGQKPLRTSHINIKPS